MSDIVYNICSERNPTVRSRGQNGGRVSRRRQRFWRFQIVVLCGLFFLPVYSTFSRAQEDERVEQGHPIGKISSQGNLIVMELNADALTRAGSSVTELVTTLKKLAFSKAFLIERRREVAVEGLIRSTAAVHNLLLTPTAS